MRKPFALVLLLALGTGGPALGEDTSKRTLTIVHTNDLHGHVENAAAVAAVAAEERAKNPRTLFLDAGDCITGTPISTLFQGRPVFEVMSRMGYDAGVLGNHDFDHGWQLVPEFREIASFPLLCANAKDPEGKLLGDAEWQVFDVGGVRVGVVGLVTDDVPTLTVKEAVAGCTFEAPLDAAKRLVPLVRKESDVVVLLTHLGIEADAAIAGAVPGIDLVVGGHTHTVLRKALSAPSGTRIVQAGSYGKYVGVVDVVWDADAKKVAEVSSRLVEVDPRTMPNAPEVKRLVEAWEAKTRGHVGEVIGRAEDRLTKTRLRTALERIYRDALGADFGYQNAAGIRSTIEAGEIRIEHVWTVLPFDNTMVKLRLRGSQLPKFARTQLGARLDPEKVYVIATNSFVADQQKKYFGTVDAPVEDTGLLMRDLVVTWVREHGGFAARRGEAPAPERADDEESEKP